MARMIPPVFDPKNRSPGERFVFDTLSTESTTAAWTVLHSQDIAHHVRQDRGECDFVVMIPGKAILCVEVKGHRRIARRNGEWILGDPSHGGKTETRGPFKQASDAMESLRQRVKRNSEFANVPFQWVCIFPFVESVQSFATDECHPWQVITEAEIRMKGLPACLLEAAESERQRLKRVPNARWFDGSKPSPIPRQIERMTMLLRPDFEMCETPSSLRDRWAMDLVRYTTEQFQALDRMQGNRRTIFDGLAGTGKTVLALECARRQAIQGDRVLLLCFNRPLRNWLNDRVMSFGETGDVTVLTASQLAWQISEGRGIDANSRMLQLEELVEKALEVLLGEGDRSFEIPPWDIIIVDEAQDVLTDGVLDLLDLLLVGGLTQGRMQAFGDFSNQAIYHLGANPIETIEARGANFTSYSLRENCRNPPVVAKLVESFGRLTTGRGYTRVLRPNSPYEPHNDFYGDEDEQHSMLVAELQRLCVDFKASEVVILSMRSEGHAASRIKPGELDIVLTTDLDTRSNAVRVSTIHRFKGLESRAVILTDIEAVTSDHARQLLYVGVSRATDQLSTLVWSGIRSEFKGAIMGRDW